MKKMDEEAILEVILVSAKNIRKKNYIGDAKYYVLLQCGDQEHESKITSGEDKKAIWNEKFTFRYPRVDWQNANHLKLRILDVEKLSKDNFIGETIIHLGGVITEGNAKGFIEVTPSIYNVVLEDDTYKGEIKIGLKFISNIQMQTRSKDIVDNEKQQPQWSICMKIFNLLQIPRWKVFSFYSKSTPLAIRKQK